MLYTSLKRILHVCFITENVCLSIYICEQTTNMYFTLSHPYVCMRARCVFVLLARHHFVLTLKHVVMQCFYMCYPINGSILTPFHEPSIHVDIIYRGHYYCGFFSNCSCRLSVNGLSRIVWVTNMAQSEWPSIY